MNWFSLTANFCNFLFTFNFGCIGWKHVAETWSRFLCPNRSWLPNTIPSPNSSKRQFVIQNTTVLLSVHRIALSCTCSDCRPWVVRLRDHTVCDRQCCVSEVGLEKAVLPMDGLIEVSSCPILQAPACCAWDWTFRSLSSTWWGWLTWLSGPAYYRVHMGEEPISLVGGSF